MHVIRRQNQIQISYMNLEKVIYLHSIMITKGYGDFANRINAKLGKVGSKIDDSPKFMWVQQFFFFQIRYKT